MNKKIIISSCIVLFLGINLFKNDKKDIINIDANYMKYDRLNNLEDSADAIITGTPLKNFDNRDHKISFFDDGTIEDFYTLTDIKVNKIFKSNYNDINENQTIEIIEPISVKDNNIITYSGYTPLDENEEYIIFLAKNSNGKYSVINMEEGKFSYNSKQYESSKNKSNSLSNQVYNKYIKK